MQFGHRWSLLVPQCVPFQVSTQILISHELPTWSYRPRLFPFLLDGILHGWGNKAENLGALAPCGGQGKVVVHSSNMKRLWLQKVEAQSTADQVWSQRWWFICSCRCAFANNNLSFTSQVHHFSSEWWTVKAGHCYAFRAWRHTWGLADELFIIDLAKILL